MCTKNLPKKKPYRKITCTPISLKIHRATIFSFTLKYFFSIYLILLRISYIVTRWNNTIDNIIQAILPVLLYGMIGYIISLCARPIPEKPSFYFQHKELLYFFILLNLHNILMYISTGWVISTNIYSFLNIFSHYVTTYLNIPYRYRPKITHLLF